MTILQQKDPPGNNSRNIAIFQQDGAASESEEMENFHIVMRNKVNKKNSRIVKSRNIRIFRMAGSSKEDRIKSSKSTTNQKVKHKIIVTNDIINTDRDDKRI